MTSTHAQPTSSADQLTQPQPLAGLHPLEYEHHLDATALNTLQQTPGLDLVVRQFNKHLVERSYTVRYTGSNIQVDRETFPTIHVLLDRACEIINLPDRPEFYLEPDHHINGFTVGVDNPLVVLTTGSIDHLTDDELLFLIGHELGHIKSRHTLYHQMARWFLPSLIDTIGQATFGLGGLATRPVQLALQYWSRMSEFTADRAGLLACQDLDAAIRVMMKWSGMPQRFYGQMKGEQFLAQARRFRELDKDFLNAAYKESVIADSTHPWSVVRAGELDVWFREGDYQKVLARQTSDRPYIRREGHQTICRRCDYRLAGGEKFCPTCGSPLRGC